MRPVAKVGLVVGGYLAAFAVAAGALALYVAATDTLERVASSGMYAFGDGVLFLGVFALASVPASGAALYYLRPHAGFWRVLAVVSLIVAATGVAADVIYLVGRTAQAPSALYSGSALAVLRILSAPLCALAFALSGLFAPNRAARIALFVAAGVEAAVFGSIAMIWFIMAAGR